MEPRSLPAVTPLHKWVLTEEAARGRTSPMNESSPTVCDSSPPLWAPSSGDRPVPTLRRVDSRGCSVLAYRIPSSELNRSNGVFSDEDSYLD